MGEVARGLLFDAGNRRQNDPQVSWTLIRPRQQSVARGEAAQGCDSLPLRSLAGRDAYHHLSQSAIIVGTPAGCHRQVADVSLAIDLRCALHATNCFLEAGRIVGMHCNGGQRIGQSMLGISPLERHALAHPFLQRVAIGNRFLQPRRAALAFTECACSRVPEPRVAEPDPPAFACASAALVRSLISPASSSATAAIMVMTNCRTAGKDIGAGRRTPHPAPLDHRQQERSVARQPVELSDDQGRMHGAAGSKRLGERRAVDEHARLDFCRMHDAAL